ncbi:MAG: alpha/beta hydrolase [Clostridiales bacterium]|nr:alpha/beta hydrolase [Clostridiales bacterium]
MKRKTILTLGAATLGAAGLTAELAIHGYLEVMAKPLKVRSVFGYIADRLADDNSEFLSFNTEKHKWIDVQDTQTVSINSDRGDVLKGYLTKPKEKSDTFVFFAHGYHTDHGGDPANFQQFYLEEMGYNFFCVDHVASGESGGNWVGFDYYESADCLKWIDYLVSQFGSDIKIILHGVSMGGATVCKMADCVPKQVKLIIADCPYTSAFEEFDWVVKSAGIKKTNGLLKLFNGINKQLAGYDLKDTDVRSAVIGAKVPMLFVHGTEDDFVPTRMGKELFELCTSEKELLLVDGAKHAESIMTDETSYHKKIREFTGKYLGGNNNAVH